jgi:hypothetical protein
MQKRITLVAGKIPSYGGKALRAGDTFDATPSDARLLTAAKLATYATRAGTTEAPRKPARPPAPPAPVDQADGTITALRARYEALAGKKAHPFWRAGRIETEIAALEAAAINTDEEPGT